ncbi:MAG TPA: hypothetical protein VIJ77_10745 [Candidatus Tumulicola sp.]
MKVIGSKNPHFQDSDSNVAIVASLLDGAKSILFLGGARPGLPQLLEKRGCVLSFVLSDPAQADEARIYASSVEVADLDRVDLGELLPGSGFNAVVFDGECERPREPWRVIDCASRVLRRDGFVLGLLPNVGHGAIRLALLKGELSSPRLDDFALRGFTLQSAHDLFERAGYEIERIDRITAPIFGGSDPLPHVERSEFSTDVIEEVEADPAATTLQFVVRAVPARASTDELSRRVAVKRTRELERSLAQAEALLAQAQADLEHTQANAQAVEARPTLEQRAALMAELDGTRRQASTSAAAAWRAQAQLGEAHTRLDELRGQLAESEAALSNRTAFVSDLESRREDMVARIGELEGALTAAQSQLDEKGDMAVRIAELESANSAVKTQLGHARTQFEAQGIAREELLGRTQTALQRRTALIVKLERTRAATQSQLDDAQAALDQRTALTTALQGVLSEQRVRFLDLECFALLAVDESERKLADAEDAWFSLYAELHEERGRATLASLTLKSHAKSLTGLQRELLATREQAQRRQRQSDDALSETRAELDASAAALRTGRERAAALAAEIAVLRVRAAGAEQKLEEVATRLSAEVAILKVRVVKFENKAAEHAGELADASQHVARLEQDLVEAGRLVQEREAGVSSALEHANRLEAELLRSAAHAQRRDAELTETAQAVARLEDERLDATAQTERLKGELIKTAEHGARLEEDLAERGRSAAALKDDLAEMERRLIVQTEELCANTQAESAQLAMLIDTVQSSRFWKFKRWLHRIRARAFGI